MKRGELSRQEGFLMPWSPTVTARCSGHENTGFKELKSHLEKILKSIWKVGIKDFIFAATFEKAGVDFSRLEPKKKGEKRFGADAKRFLSLQRFFRPVRQESRVGLEEEIRRKQVH